jgi:hypothetical protein
VRLRRQLGREELAGARGEEQAAMERRWRSCGSDVAERNPSPVVSAAAAFLLRNDEFRKTHTGIFLHTKRTM